MKILIIGGGYIGSRCAKAWPEAVVSEKMIETKEDALNILNEHKPDAVLNAAGIIGRPNVDWCDTNQVETIKGNSILPFIIAEACQEFGVYLLHIGSGCIFYGESPDPKGWKEDDFANPAVTYTKSKYAADLMLMNLPNVGIARIRMPIDEVPYRGNLIDKLASFQKVIDVENSVTVVPDLVHVFHELLTKKAAGIFHVTNPGSIKHREILDMYKEYVDPTHETQWIEEGELVSCGLAAKKRSNNILQSDNLKNLGIEMREIHQAVRETMIEYAKNKKAVQ